MAANTYTTYGIADGPSEAGIVRVVMEGEALAQPSEEEVSETIPAERFERGRASLAAEPYPGTTQVWRGSEAEANLLDESEWTVEGATLTIWGLASDPVALVEWETSLSRELTDADFAGGRAALMGEPSSVTLTEDDEPVPYELDGSVLVVEGMGGHDGLVRATYSHAVELTLPAGTSTLPDAPAEVTVVGRILGETPSEEPAPYVLDGAVLTIAEGWDEYVVTYSVQVVEGWSLSEQVREEPAPDSEEGEEGTLEPTSEVVGHVLQWDPEGLSVTLDGEPTADWTLDGRTVTVGASGASRTLSLTCTMPQSIEVPSSALRASYELPTLPSGEVSVTVGGEALPCTVEDRAVTVPSLLPEVAQYAVRYSAMVPQGSVEMPCAPVVQDGESVVVTVINGSPMVTAVMGSGDAQQGQLDDAATIAVEAAGAADSAVQAAEEAAEIASAVGQHFWAADDGIHVTEVTEEEWNDSTGQSYHSGANVLISSIGQLFRTGLNNLLGFITSPTTGVAIFDGLGNAAANVVGLFTADGVTLGREAESHAEVGPYSLRLVDEDGTTYFRAVDLRGSDGYITITEEFEGNGLTDYFDLQFRIAESRAITVTVDGVETTEYEMLARAIVSPYAPAQNLEIEEVLFDSAPADGAAIAVTYESDDDRLKAYTLGLRRVSRDVAPMSVAEGYITTASGLYSHAEGDDSWASGEAAHAEGERSRASGTASHSEGTETVASGTGAHAEGAVTSASHMAAHAEGWRTTAGGIASHAQGLWTIANGDWQTALGRHNVADTTSAVIIGNGTSSTARSNALTVDWSGNVSAAGGATLADNVTLYDGTGSPRYQVRSELVDRDSDTAPSSWQYADGLELHDKDDETIGRVYTAWNTSNAMGTGIEAITEDSNGNEVMNFLRVWANKDGTKTYSVGDRDNFRAAISAARASWVSLGSFTGTNSLTINLSDYEEVMVAAKFNHTNSGTTTHKLATATIAKQLLSTTAQELWLGGGKSSGSTANSGSLRAIVNITTTKVTGVISSADSTDHTSGTTWYVYAR